MLTAEFAERINVFAHRLQAHLAEHHDPAPTIRVSPRGRRKLRVYFEWADDRPDQVYCFVRTGDGAVLKATGWGRCVYANPICSHIYDEDFGLSTCHPAGVCYPGIPVNHPPITDLLRP